MRNRKRCIFHVPNHIDISAKSGSQVRPMKIIKALTDIGYDVDVVMGYGRERKKSIQSIKENIKNGVRYEFMYSESSTMPTLLTEKNHLPVYPKLDFGFFKFCKKNSIKIGLFYRDVIWRFEQYRASVPWYYRIVTFFFYKYDLWKYRKLVDILYLPSERIKDYIPECRMMTQKILPPGAEYCPEILKKRQEYFNSRKFENIRIFYVGGVTGIYDILEFVKAIRDRDKIFLTICCKEEEWIRERSRYKPFLTERVNIVHESGKDLIKYYLQADICSCYFDVNRHPYMQLAIPVKLLEYVSFITPVIATSNSCAANFVEKYDIGWTIPYGKDNIQSLLDFLLDNPGIISSKQKHISECLYANTWEQRMLQIEKELRSEE